MKVQQQNLLQQLRLYEHYSIDNNVDKNSEFFLQNFGFKGYLLASWGTQMFKITYEQIYMEFIYGNLLSFTTEACAQANFQLSSHTHKHIECTS
jgi:hypothetical protein